MLVKQSLKSTLLMLGKTIKMGFPYDFGDIMSCQIMDSHWNRWELSNVATLKNYSMHNILQPLGIVWWGWHLGVKTPTPTSKICESSRVWETFELNQLKSIPSLLVFPVFDRLQTCCLSFGHANILYIFFKCRLISSSL